MRAVELVVAVCDDHERGDVVQAMPEQPKDIERRLVRPLQVLEDDRGRPAAQLLGQGGGDLMRPAPGQHKVEELSLSRLRHVEQRPQRPWREERVAGSDEHSRARLGVRKVAHQGGLADASLSAHEHQPPSLLGGDGFELLGQHGKLFRTFEQNAFFVSVDQGACHLLPSSPRTSCARRHPEIKETVSPQ